ncbi:MAG: succinate dehydrogenase, hydrophobic membrane anchor protein [Tabrizicola sp.]|nr:succinate dehydrogenase, hydrophobic membrane anchor protein [Tabrizicola sp.]
MRYLTPRKRAEGKGAAHAGTEHHWAMTVSAVALAFLLPMWLYIFGSTLGETREAVVETFARPFPAILTALVLVVGMRHFAMGATTMIEDYARGASRKILIIAVILFSWATVATGLFALARIAL